MADDIIFSLDGDASKSVEAVDQIISAIDKLKQAFDGLSGVASALDGVDTAFYAVGSTILEVEKAIQSAAQGFSAFTQAGQTVAQVAQTISDSTKVVADASQQATQQVQQVASALKEEDDAAQQAVGANQALADSLKAVVDSLTQTVDALKQEIDLLKQQADAGSQAAQIAQTLDELNQRYADGAAKAEKMVAAIDKLTTSMVALAEDANKAADSLGTAAGNTGKYDEAITLAQETSAKAADSILKLQEAAAKLGTSFGEAGSAITNYAKAADAGAAASGKMAASMTQAAAAEKEAAGIMADASTFFSANAVNLMILQTMLVNTAKGFLQMGIDAQTSLSQLTGLADQSLSLAENTGKLNAVIKETESVALKYGVTMKEAADALYFVASAGFDTKDALTIMNSVMEASAATGSKAEEVGIALTSILNAYNLKAGDAKKITDEMTQAVVQGNQTFNQFANVIGGVASEAARAGVSFEEAAAAESAMSIVQPRVRQDGQNLIHLFQNLHDKIDKIAEVAKSMGKSFDENAFQAMSLIDKLKYIAQIAGGDTTVAFRELTGDVTGTKTAYMLLHDGTEQYMKVLNAEQNALGATDKALAEHEKTIQGSADRIKAAASVISYEIVRMASPMVAPILQKIADALDALSQHLDKARPLIAAVGVALATIMVGSGVALIGFLLSLLGPVGGLAIGFGVLAGAGVALVDRFKAIYEEGKKLPPLVQILHKYFEDFGHWAKNELPTPWQEAEGAIAKFIDYLKNVALPFIGLIGQNIVKQFQMFMREVVDAVKEKGQQIGEQFAAMTPKLEEWINKGLLAANAAALRLSDALFFLWEHLDTIKGILATVGGAFLGFKAFLLASQIDVLGWGGALADLFPIIGRILPAIAGLGDVVAMLANPFALAAIAIGALIAYGLHLLQLSGQLQTILSNLWDMVVKGAAEVKQAWDGLVKQVQTELAPAWKQLMDELQPLKPLFDELAKLIAQLPFAALALAILLVVSALKGLIEQIKMLVGFLTGIVKMITEIIEAFKALGRAIDDLLHGHLDKIPGEFGSMADHSTKSVGGMADAVGAILSHMWGYLADIFSLGTWRINGLLQKMSDDAVGHSIIPDMANKIVAVFKNLWQQVQQPVKDFCDGVIKSFQDLADKLVGHSIVPEMLDKIGQSFSQSSDSIGQVVGQMVQSILKPFQDMGQQASQLFSQMMQNIGQAVQQGGQGAIQGIMQMITGISTPLRDLSQQATGWGRDMMNGFGQGLQSAASWVIMGVMGVANQISMMLHFSRPDTGPLADYETWMPDFGEGLAQGLMAQTGKVRSAAQQVAQAITASMPTAAGLGSYTANSNPTNDAALAVLKEILATLKNNGTQQGTMGRGLTSAQLGTLQQQFVINANGGSNITNLYSQLNNLLGLSSEYTARGAATGLGW